MSDVERARLEGWIAGSRRVQRRLAVAIAVMAVAGIALVIGWPMIGGLFLLFTAIVGVCGFWVTAAHIADWRLRLRTMDEVRVRGGRRRS